jgi:hypothetical protein
MLLSAQPQTKYLLRKLGRKRLYDIGMDSAYVIKHFRRNLTH